METVTANAKPVEIDLFSQLKTSKNLKDFFNHEQSTISFRIYSMDINNRDAGIEVRAEREIQGQNYVRTANIKVRISKTLMSWFTYVQKVYNENKEDTGERLTGYQKYLRSINQEVTLPIDKIRFTSLNRSIDYKANPFRLNINLEYDRSTLYSVTESRYQAISFANPMNPGHIQERFIKPKRADNGKPVTLKKENYIRLQIK